MDVIQIMRQERQRLHLALEGHLSQAVVQAEGNLRT